MTTVKEIEQAVAKLPAGDLEAFRAWFENFEASMWDKQIEQDVSTGKLDRHTDEAIKDLEEGRCTEL